MKVRAYLLTFFSYIFFHSLMTAFSFVTPYFRQTYHLSNLYLGIIDCTLYFSKGLGFLLRYRIIKQSKIMKHFLISSTIFILAFILFPFLSIVHFIDESNVESILFVLITTYGFFLYNNWAVSLSIVSQYFTTEKDGCLLGFWSAAGDFGSMAGFIFPSLLIIQLGWPWEVPLIILSIITFLLCYSVYKFIPKDNNIQNLSTEDPQKQDEMLWLNFKTYFFSFHKRWQNILFTVILCCYRALTYTFLLWLPSYLDSQGQNSHSAMLSIIFNVTTIIGSFILGKVYEIKTTKITNETLVTIVFSIVGLIIVVGFIVMIVIPFSVVTYSILIAIEGFGIGGFYNTLTCNEILFQVGDSERQLNFFTIVTGGISNFVVGITMLVIGIYINANILDNGEKNRNAYENIFKVALAISILGLLLLLVRAIYLKSVKSNEQSEFVQEKQLPKLQKNKT